MNIASNLFLPFLVAVISASPDVPGAISPAICDNMALLRAVRVVNDACTDSFCDPTKLREIEDIKRGDLLSALRDPYLMPVHIFFPSGKSRLTDAFDWNTIKEEQLRTIASINDPDETIIFIVGYASKTGDEALNVRLSRDRMYAVYFYLKNVLGVKCKTIKGAWVGKTILQLQPSDASLLGLTARDYREDPLIINQAVHVFIYPCASRL